MPACSADNDNVNVNDLRSSIANNDNDNLRSSLANQGTWFADNDNDDNFMYVINEKHQKGKPSSCGTKNEGPYIDPQSGYQSH